LWLEALKRDGYREHIVFFWLSSPDLAVSRVADRVRSGGHSIPDDVIRRRYRAGLRNFFDLYEASASTWRVYNNSGQYPKLVADRLDNRAPQVYDEPIWKAIVGQGSDHEG